MGIALHVQGQARPVIGLVLLFSASVCAWGQQQVHFDSADADGGSMATRLKGYLYRPDTPGPSSAAVLMHGCGGLYDRHSGAIAAKMRFWAQYLRERGYIALLVDSFRPRGLDEICTRRGALDARRGRSWDAYGALVYLRRQPFVDPERVALIGWSNGARATLSAMAQQAQHRPEPLPRGGFRAAIAFYPQCGVRYSPDPIYKPYAPLLILIGELDDWTPAKPCVDLTRAGKETGAPMEVVVYPGAHHSFDSPDSPVRHRPEVRNRNKPGGCCGATVGTNPDARDDARRRVLAFLAAHLQGPSRRASVSGAPDAASVRRSD